jgi:hypothetical protein
LWKKAYFLYETPIFPTFSPLTIFKEEIDNFSAWIENVLGTNWSMGDTQFLWTPVRLLLLYIYFFQGLTHWAQTSI